MGRALQLQYLLARSETDTTLVLFDTTGLGCSSRSLEIGTGEIPMMELLDVNSLGFSAFVWTGSEWALVSFESSGSSGTEIGIISKAEFSDESSHAFSEYDRSYSEITLIFSDAFETSASFGSSGTAIGTISMIEVLDGGSLGFSEIRNKKNNKNKKIVILKKKQNNLPIWTRRGRIGGSFGTIRTNETSGDGSRPMFLKVTLLVFPVKK